MEFNDSRTEPISVELSNGRVIKFEAAQTGREDVAFGINPFTEVTDALEGFVEAISSTVQRVQPKKATVKFGLDVAIESGNLTATIVKGSGKANLEITLEFEQG